MTATKIRDTARNTAQQSPPSVPDQKNRRVLTPRVELEGAGSEVELRLVGDEAEWWATFQAALGGVEKSFARSLMQMLVNALPAGPDGIPDREAFNGALQMICGMQPSDEAEAMLLAQMAVAAQTALVINGQLVRTASRHQQSDQGNLVNKLMRTYGAQMETLKRYRGKGEQRVVVEHVHVYEGGQAIVGQVSPGGGRGSASNSGATS